MTYTIYGLRLKGDREVRYIGQTNSAPEHRLHLHFCTARLRRGNEALCDWLLANEGRVEVFKIGAADTLGGALEFEALTYAVCSAAGQRLLNGRILRSQHATPFIFPREIADAITRAAA